MRGNSGFAGVFGESGVEVAGWFVDGWCDQAKTWNGQAVREVAGNGETRGDGVRGVQAADRCGEVCGAVQAGDDGNHVRMG